MREVVKAIDGVRVGMIKITNVPKVDLPIEEYSVNRLQEFLREHRKFKGQSTKLGYSLYLANEALAKEKTDVKTVVVLSDGGEDTCWRYQICDMTDEWIPYRMQQLDQADKIRKAGAVQFIYVAVGETINPKHWRYNTTKYDIIAIAGGEENVIYAGEYKVQFTHIIPSECV
ncbi:hypothetical protein OSTOST_25197 [Ostertagia ostertagi]